VGQVNSFTGLLGISLAISIFKLVWNTLIIGGWEQTIFDTTLSDQTLVGICLFNMLLAPLIAELFVSPDCFVYILSEAPSLTSYYHTFACFILQLSLNGHSATEVKCNLNKLETAQLTVPTPFNYSYQCSFALVSDYVYVFIFRYILAFCGELIFILLMRQTSPSMANNGTIGKMIDNMMPPAWKLFDGKFASVTMSYDDVLEDQLQSIEDEFVNKATQFRRKVLSRFVVDFVLILCIGSLFPLLAFVIALNIVKDCWKLRVVLTKLQVWINQASMIVVATNDADDGSDDKKLDLQKRLVKLQQHICSMLYSVIPLVRDGISLGIRMSVWIWAYIVLDVLASEVGVRDSIAMTVVILVLPYILTAGYQFVLKQDVIHVEIEMMDANNGISEMVNKHIDTESITVNPVHDQHGKPTVLQSEEFVME
jgi:hypothetical protein